MKQLITTALLAGFLEMPMGGTKKLINKLGDTKALKHCVCGAGFDHRGYECKDCHTKKQQIEE
jgi:hypothetical protein